MQKSKATELCQVIWKHYTDMRGRTPFGEVLPRILLTLYSYHKGYTNDVSDACMCEMKEKDSLYHDLCEAGLTVKSLDEVYNIKALYRYLESIPYEEYEALYPEALKTLIEMWAENVGAKEGEFATPKAINELLMYLAKQYDIKSIYDPFCGVASLVSQTDNSLCDITFRGQERLHITAMIANVLCEAYTGETDLVVCDDTIMHWGNVDADAIVTCPPMGVNIAPHSHEAEMLRMCDSKNLEEYIFKNAFSISQANTVIVLEPAAITYTQNHFNLRKWLVDNNYLDTVIALPSNLLFSSSIACVVLVCNRKRAIGSPIRFVYADEMYKGKHSFDRTFDFKRFVEAFESNSITSTLITVKAVAANDYLLSPAVYCLGEQQVKEGQQSYKLSDLLIPVRSEKLYGDSLMNDYITSSMLSTDIISILLHKDSKTSYKEERHQPNIKTYQGSDKTFILCSSFRDSRFALHETSQPFMVSGPVKVFVANTKLVSAEYLVYKLLENEVIKTGQVSIDNLMSMNLIIDSKEEQDKIIETCKVNYFKKQEKIRVADAKRLGIKQSVSDMEHMLGTPRMKIQKILYRLENLKPGAEGYNEVLKDLKDNLAYQDRIIRFCHAEIDAETFRKTECDILALTEQYAASWRNYGGPYFELTIDNSLDMTVQMDIDKNMFTVMLDAILNNAVRHAFMKRKDYTPHNEVQISLSLVQKNGQSFVQMSIANNGEPFKEGFTLQDYISKGRFSEGTGRSGLGGYHVYAIAKGHGGYVALDCNKTWNTVVDVLLPCKNIEPSTLPEYERESV